MLNDESMIKKITRQTRRFFGGGRPLCGNGVLSSIAVIFRPLFWSAVIADSRPLPGPFTRTSISCRPHFLALAAQFSAARVAAKGVDLRAPLKPTVPAESQARVSPLTSVMVTWVLLKEAFTWAMPLMTFFRIFFLPVLAMGIPLCDGLVTDSAR